MDAGAMMSKVQVQVPACGVTWRSYHRGADGKARSRHACKVPRFSVAVRSMPPVVMNNPHKTHECECGARL